MPEITIHSAFTSQVISKTQIHYEIASVLAVLNIAFTFAAFSIVVSSVLFIGLNSAGFAITVVLSLVSSFLLYYANRDIAPAGFNVVQLLLSVLTLALCVLLIVIGNNAAVGLEYLLIHFTTLCIFLVQCSRVLDVHGSLLQRHRIREALDHQPQMKVVV